MVKDVGKRSSERRDEMKNTSELDCHVVCIMCGKSNHLSMYAFRAKDRDEKIVGWVFLCDWCNKNLDEKGYQLRWFFEDEDGKKLF